MNKDYSSEGGLLEEARQGYAASRAKALSLKLQEVSVAKFEVDHLPEPRKVYVKKGALLYLTPRAEAKASLESREREVGEKLAAMQALASPHTK